MDSTENIWSVKELAGIVDSVDVSIVLNQ